MPTRAELQNLDNLSQKERIKLAIRVLKDYTQAMQKLSIEQKQIILDAIKQEQTQKDQLNINKIEEQINNL